MYNVYHGTNRTVTSKLKSKFCFQKNVRGLGNLTKSTSVDYMRTEGVLTPNTVACDEEVWQSEIQQKTDRVNFGNFLFFPLYPESSHQGQKTWQGRRPKNVSL